MRRPRVTLRRRELLGAVALLGVTLVPTGTPAEAAIAPTEWFHCTRASDSYRVPNHVTRVHVMAGGGVGGWGVSNAGDPGSAAAVGGELIVVPTESLYIKVGCAGETVRGGWGDPYGGYSSQSGGGGGLSYCCNTSYGGGGGGASVVSTLTSGCGAYLGNVTECVVAGGGGGSAGGTSGCTNLWGGAGGYGGAQGQNGAKGNSGSAGNGGRGASQTSLHAAGGSGGPGGGHGDAGDPYVGSSPWIGMGGDAGNGGSGSCWGGGGGGGGAGYRGGGGGGGGAAGHGGGGGGGGSSWIGPLMGGTIIPASNAYHGYVTVTPLGPASAAVRGSTWPQGAQTLAVGQTSSVWIYVYDQYGNTMPNTDVAVNVEGVHTRSATIRTDSWGSANYTWVGTTSGVDIARFTVGGVVLAAVGTAWQPGATPTSVALTPPAQNHNVGTYATVTATVRDTFGNPVGGVPVRFTRSFANPGQVSVTTNWAGEATHTYRCNNQGVDDIEATVINSTVVPARAEVVCVPTTVPTTIPDILTTSTTAGP